MRHRRSAAPSRVRVASVVVALVGTLLATVPGAPALSAAPKDRDRRLIEQTETADIYTEADGSHTAVFYAGQVNFFDKGTRQWRKLDKQLRRKNARIENGDGPVRVELPSEVGAGDVITVRKDDWAVSYAFAGAASKRPARLNDGRVRYDDVAPGISLEYRMLSNGLKEDIVLDQPPAADWPGYYRFQLSTKGLTPVPVDSGTAIALLDAEGREQGRIPRGTMVDAKGMKGVVDMHLVEHNGDHFIDVAPDVNFVRSAERAYPLTVDPVVLYGVPSPTDSFVDEACQSCNYNGLDFLKAGRLGSAQYYSFVRFPDLTRILGKQVGYAELRVYATYEDDPLGKGLLALRTHGSWNASSITWANMPNHGDAQNYRINKNVQSGPNYSFTVTSWAQGWAAGLDGEWINGKWSPYGATVNTGGDTAFYELGAAESTFVPEIPSMTVHYTNESPNVPPDPSLAPANGWTGTSAPTLRAGFSDPDDANGWIDFRIDGGPIVGVPTVNGTASYLAPVGSGTHSWVARGRDVDSAGPWSSSRSFTVNSALAPPVLLFDGFGLLNGDLWDGTKWTTTTNDGTRVADIQVNQGRLGVTSSSSRATAKISPVADSDVTLTYRFQSNTNRSFFRPMLRAQGATGSGQMPTGYRVEIRSDSNNIKLQSCVNSTCSNPPLASYSYFTSSNKTTNPQKLRFQVQGTQVRVKTWPAGAAEPTNWQLSLANSSITAPGVLQLNHNFDTGTNQLEVDDVVIANPTMAQATSTLTFRIAHVDNPEIIVQGECHAYNAMHFSGAQLSDGNINGTWAFGGGNDCLRNDMDFTSVTGTLRRVGGPSFGEAPIAECYWSASQNCRLVQTSASAGCVGCQGAWQLETQHLLDLKLPYIFLEEPLGCEYVSPVRRDALQCDVITNDTLP